MILSKYWLFISLRNFVYSHFSMGLMVFPELAHEVISLNHDAKVRRKTARSKDYGKIFPGLLRQGE
jgi:hypothetical protein